MKMTKMALLAGAALAVTTVGAQADDLNALKAQIEALNARVAAMETAPSVPAGYQLIAVSEGDLQQTPGLDMTARELAAYGTKSTVISVLPTADAPAGTTISWSGYARAGLVYKEESTDLRRVTSVGGVAGPVTLDTDPTPDITLDAANPAETSEDDIDVPVRGQLRVKASTDTAVGEVGVDLRLRGNFSGGNGSAGVIMDVAWGYWAMTPELTFGGGYSGSLGNIDYGYDGACNCNYTDNAGLDFNPGDVTQFRLSYASGPVSFAVALEDGSTDADVTNGDKLGAAGEVKYSGDMFSGEISGVWRDMDESSTGADALWQVGAGLGIAMGDMASLSLGGAMGEGAGSTDFGSVGIDSATPPTFSANGQNFTDSWWGVSALASVKLSDEIHMELAAGYKERDGDSLSVTTGDASAVGNVDWSSSGVESSTLGFLAGIYYEPVDQLTIGIEGEIYTTDTELNLAAGNSTIGLSKETEAKSVNLVTVWRF
jgi:hypothetical protein